MQLIVGFLAFPNLPDVFLAEICRHKWLPFSVFLPFFSSLPFLNAHRFVLNQASTLILYSNSELCCFLALLGEGPRRKQGFREVLGLMSRMGINGLCCSSFCLPPWRGGRGGSVSASTKGGGESFVSWSVVRGPWILSMMIPRVLSWKTRFSHVWGGICSPGLGHIDFFLFYF